MRVFVTQEQFAAIREAKLRFDITNRPRDHDALVEQLTAASLANGGDYNPALHDMGVPVRLTVVPPAHNGK